MLGAAALPLVECFADAVLSVCHSIGQIPSFVGDMERPEDFPKALAVSMVFEFALFTITGAVVYHYAYVAFSTYFCTVSHDYTS